MNHFARVCNKRRSPRSSPNKSSISTRRPQSPWNNQFGHQNSSRINKLEPELDQMTVIWNLQEQLNQLQMRQQREVNAHSLKTTPISMQPSENTADHLPCPPPFFISRKRIQWKEFWTHLTSMDIQSKELSNWTNRLWSRHKCRMQCNRPQPSKETLSAGMTSPSPTNSEN